MDAAERTSRIAENSAPADYKSRLWCKGRRQEFEVFRVPVNALLLNPDNKRFATARILIEHRLGRSLDPANRLDDEEAIISLLLDAGVDVEDGQVVSDKAGKDYLALYDDWVRHDQDSPIWIRPDGTVHNGNRRVAMLKREASKRGPEGFDYIDAVILTQDQVSNEDLFRMEQREQFTGNFKVQYTDVDLLVALREAAELEGIDWYDSESIERVARALQHIAGRDTEQYAIVQLYAIRYMDEYLADIEAPGQYHLLRRQVERVRAVGRIMRWIEQEFPYEADKVLRLALSFVKAGLPHGRILAIRRLFLEDRPRFDQLVARVESTEEEAYATVRPHIEEPSPADVTAESEDDDGDQDSVPSVLADYPGDRVTDLATNAIDAITSASAEVANRLEQAWNRLETIDEAGLSSALAKNPNLLETIRSLISWSEQVAASTLPSDR